MQTDRARPARPAFQIWSKRATVLVLVCLLIAAVWFFLRTDAGRNIRHDPRTLATQVRHIVGTHPFTSRLGFISLYTVLALLALPIWWLQILGGIGFGLYEGSFYSLIGSTVCATITVTLIRWIAADWFHQRIEARMDQLKKLDQTLGHNGLLFVMTVRLIPLLPFGLFNYALGLSRISYTDVILGTFLGAIPAILVHVGIGAQYFLWRDWGFDFSVTTITIILLMPLLLRYLRPDWFKKIGVE